MKILLVRHGSASSPDAWCGNDQDRPLDAHGFKQAQALADTLSQFAPVTIFSSEAVRCLQTVTPLAQIAGVEISVTPMLYEGALTDGVQLVNELARTGSSNGPMVLCSHGDVISKIVHGLKCAGMETLNNGGCAKGSVWELSCRNGRVLKGCYHLPPEVLGLPHRLASSNPDKKPLSGK